MELKSERLVLREFRAEDAQDLYEYLSRPEVVRFESYDVFSREQCEKEARDRAQNPAFWAIALGDKVIGNIYLGKTDEDCYSIGWVLNPDFQHHGYATEAAQMVLAWAFGAQGAWRVEARCDPLNPASQHIMERLHMRHEGTMRKNVWFKTDENGQPIWKNTMVYAILADEWRKGGAR